MTHKPQDMSEDFVPYANKIAALLAEGGEFAKLFGQYEVVNNEIFASEQEISPIDDLGMETLKKKRLVLKDQIISKLAATK